MYWLNFIWRPCQCRAMASPLSILLMTLMVTLSPSHTCSRSLHKYKNILSHGLDGKKETKSSTNYLSQLVKEWQTANNGAVGYDKVKHMARYRNTWRDRVWWYGEDGKDNRSLNLSLDRSLLMKR